MVWRATPRAAAASARDSHPAGTSGTMRRRSSSVMRRCHGPPGGELLAGDETGAEPSIQGHLGHAQDQLGPDDGHHEGIIVGGVTGLIGAKAGIARETRSCATRD